MTPWVQTLLQVDADPVEYYCTGPVKIMYGANEYLPLMIDIDNLENRADVPDERITVTLDVRDTRLRVLYLVDRGPLQVTATKVKSDDQGNTWTSTGAVFIGKLSATLYRDQKCYAEVETLKGDVDRGEVVHWSHEDQQRNYPGDLGLQWVRETVHQDPERNFGWPP